MPIWRVTCTCRTRAWFSQAAKPQREHTPMSMVSLRASWRQS
ncbi:hypothetical protein PV963_02080 [Streptomyces coeruleorubidus]|nr:hypothetical protein [Streptomyces coeruleorubidus]WDV49305.1 hypothetical protein PV963_02080 [Streptomyces coeruleorubidus]